MDNLRIPHDALVFVGDGRKALFLRNAGDERFPNLKAERVLVDDNDTRAGFGSPRPRIQTRRDEPARRHGNYRLA